MRKTCIVRLGPAALRFSAIAVVLLVPLTAAADPIQLGSATSPTVSVGLCCQRADQLTFAFVIFDDASAPRPAARLFDLALARTMSDDTFVAQPTNAEFNRFAELMTNGVSNSLDLQFFLPTDGLTASYGTSESGWFRLPFGNDFSGFHITKLTLHMDDVSISPDLSGASVRATLNVFGEKGAAATPEPAPLLLVATGAALLAMRRSRTARK